MNEVERVREGERDKIKILEKKKKKKTWHTLK